MDVIDGMQMFAVAQLLVSYTASGFPFECTALDHFLPTHIHTAEGVQKRWVEPFICLKVRAVHLGLVGNLPIDNFLHHFRHFIAKRGRSRTILSDNATSFKLAFRALPLARWRVAENGTEWDSVTQLASWKRWPHWQKTPFVKLLAKQL